MIGVDEARKRVLEAVEPVPVEEVRVADALGTVLAQEMRAPHPLPRFDNSAMDGYAVRAADASAASEDSPVALRLVGEIKAGDPGDVTVGPGTAARIMTGAPLPPGADAIAPVEVTREEDGRVLVLAPAARGV
ncbi:MAG TPA: molybdopterin molybdenumtransferase MoeA, partial [Actinomycetota bacterium]|nr:molybdopterin molybdenumtransferase MoeA [Actinomycetota bacterium]